jgi:hypothetical protein
MAEESIAWSVRTCMAYSERVWQEGTEKETLRLEQALSFLWEKIVITMYMVTTEEWYDYVLCIKGSENKLSENVFLYTKTNFT